jgi:hypothetical protein
MSYLDALNKNEAPEERRWETGTGEREIREEIERREELTDYEALKPWAWSDVEKKGE